MKTRKVVKTVYGAYEVVLDPNSPEKGYTVTVPALKGVVTLGASIKESLANAKEAIELHCQVMLAEGTARVAPLARTRSVA